MRAFYGLFNIVLALGSLQIKEGTSTATRRGDVFFDRAESLMADKSMDHDSLTSVQVFILMAHYLHTTGKVNKCWVAVGTAIRTAQGIGIHLCPASHSRAQQQERRRTWSYCLQMDRLLGMMFGRQPMVPWSTGDADMDMTDDDLLSTEPFTSTQPAPVVQNSVLGFFIHSDKYSEILLKVLK